MANRYEEAFATRPEWRLRSPHLNNNVAVCAVRRAFSAATSRGAPGHRPDGADAQRFHATAADAFAAALAMFGDSDERAGAEAANIGGGGLSDKLVAVRDNARKFAHWQAHGGDFQGSLMW